MTTSSDRAAQSASFLKDWRTLCTIGETPDGGVDRQAASAADGQSRAWFSALAGQYGFRIELDKIGNLFALAEWTPGAPYVVVGSHLDSQPTAGKYDGAYGVAAGLHAAKRINDEVQSGAPAPQYNLAVVDWFNEEGSRFVPSMMGSSVYTGKLALETALDARDTNGITVREALDRIGQRGTGDGPKAVAAAEIHIQQGRSMEESGITIGLVHACWAAAKYTVTVHGEQAHSGGTIIADRRDALLGASHLVVFLRELANSYQGGALRTSVGQLDVYPNSPVVVPSRVELLMDLRSADNAVLDDARKRLWSEIADIEKRASVTIEVNESHKWGLLPYHPAGVELAGECADALGLTHDKVLTVAGHDSINLKDQVPTVMLFVPSVDGISHNEQEYTTDEDICAGTDVLTAVVRRLCDGELDGATVDASGYAQ
ncbi:M20 family metallo-hydrolase [Mycolicibacterium brisbanense]|uniref:N-carbamoyl-L-amino acid amidohydrolase n=1 Tax=Mycolicibacterium brisbanense TaxID=146020 RepID=A0A100W4Y6_9MYCO|nr:M20 family metallo-hydrolase [Mycolicibacterium brisbanense]MCV7160283.1 M20 family metallo-hydrolase [Mycolicibacterium brisbanense]GAS91671.1 N-carbamoyl-L-amino acid amidohydrolase [Mycolicibacterium brisbanense]